MSALAIGGSSTSLRARLVAFLVALAACVALALPALAADVPFLTGRIVDEANILSAGVEQDLSQMSEKHEQATGNQVVVLTLPSLEGESIEGFATRVFDAWKLGQKGKDNGVLVIVAPNDRKMRIEVGYGLEGTLTDAGASRIIREAMTPQFKSGNYEAGIQNGAIVSIKRSDTAESGEIVVALIDDTEATLKRLRKKGASIALEPANAAYETRIFGPDRVKIQGRLAGLYRRYH